MNNPHPFTLNSIMFIHNLKIKTMMKQLFAVAFLALGVFFLASCGDAPQTDTDTEVAEALGGTYTVDVANSVVKWKGAMLGIKFHEGTLKLTDGSLTVDNGVVTGGSFTVDMTSIVATDENYQPEEGSTREKLIEHLSSNDFFNVAEFPTATFTITSGQASQASGDLTIRGITNSETVQNIMLVEADGVVKANGNLTFDRKKYNVAWDSPMKEVVLSNEIELSIELAASKN